MNVEEELLAHLAAIPDGETKSRNVAVVTHFLGFGDQAWPTLEETGTRFGIGTRERVRQIVAKTFRDRTDIDDLPSLRDCAEFLASRPAWIGSDLSGRLVERGWISPGTGLRAILNVMQELGFRAEYDLYDGRVDAIGRANATTEEDVLVLSRDAAGSLREVVRAARGLPGMLGLADVEYVETGEVSRDLFLAAIGLDPDAWIARIGERTWFAYEDRENTLVNGAAKVFSFADEVEVERLSSALAGHLRRRAHEFEYPGEVEIERYVRGSRFFDCVGDVATFRGDPAPLTEIDEAIVAYFEGGRTTSFVEIRDHLLSLGFGAPHVQKAVGNSVLVHVDKSLGRQRYVYGLVAAPGAAAASPDEADGSRYRRFAERLRRVGDLGTDASVESTVRREQAILSQWLFEGRSTCRCAMCGDEYGVRSLVTAHKKRRTECNETERLDPYVVMPLCLFGCDHVYERGLAEIVNGEVVARRDRAVGPGELAALERIDGRRLSAEWTMGDPTYFARDGT